MSPPANVRLTIEDIYDASTGKPKPEVLKEHFQKEGRLEEEAALKIITQGMGIMHTFCYCYHN